MNKVYDKAYTEILEIIKYLPPEEIEKVPKEKIEFYKKHCDHNYRFEYNPFKSLKEQNVSRETMVLIVILFRDIIATKEQKEKLNRILSQNEQKYQKRLNEKYNTNNLFNKKRKRIAEDNMKIIVYKENVFLKIYNLIKDLFKKK